MPFPALLSLLVAAQLGQQTPQIRTRFVPAAPLPNLPSVMVDSFNTGNGLAAETARGLGLQARILWIDATANLDRLNSAEKIQALIANIADSGFNTVVLDVKPISGQTLYPSKLAPRLLEWRGRTMPADFDPLAEMCKDVKPAGLSLLVSFNAFSEGHNLFKVGPGYAQPDWQTVLYEGLPVLTAPNGATYPIKLTNEWSNDLGSLCWFTLNSKVPVANENNFAVTIDKTGKVIDGFEYGGWGPGVPTVPVGGSVLVGSGGAATFLKQVAEPGTKLKFDTSPNFVRSGERPERQYPLIVNPNSDAVQDYELNIVREVVLGYPVDGVLFDDRFRYAGLDADFSETTRKLFEHEIGHPLKWPDDVFHYTLNPNNTRGIRPGPLYDAWIAWRALQLKRFLYRTRLSVKALRPNCQVGLYAGSWYGDYPALGSNWSADNFDAGFWFLTPEYKRAGVAGLLDFFIAGCYYTVPTIYDAMSTGLSTGATVEASATLVNRAMRDQTWSYAGLAVDQFKGNQEALKNCLQAACASSQGVMVFDLSHDVDTMWPLFREAFGAPRRAPHVQADLIGKVRQLRAQLDKKGAKEPTVVIMAGTVGTGQ